LPHVAPAPELVEVPVEPLSDEHAPRRIVDVTKMPRPRRNGVMSSNLTPPSACGLGRVRVPEHHRAENAKTLELARQWGL
jgi:hypothetical protein